MTGAYLVVFALMALSFFGVPAIGATAVGATSVLAGGRPASAGWRSRAGDLPFTTAYGSRENVPG